LGRSIPERRYRAGRVVSAIQSILDDDASIQRRTELASRIDSGGAVARACALIEGLGQRRAR
jgi:hypothetical protein